MRMKVILSKLRKQSRKGILLNVSFYFFISLAELLLYVSILGSGIYIAVKKKIFKRFKNKRRISWKNTQLENL